MALSYVTRWEKNMPFHGAKLALFLGDALAVILRDDDPGIPFPGYWDLPGGGREGDESPVACVLRETREELGLRLDAQVIHWGRPFDEGSAPKWFFVAHAPQAWSEKIVLGDEGQRWQLMPPQEFLSHRRAVPKFQERLRLFLSEQEQGC